jgi:hypothetical protein
MLLQRIAKHLFRELYPLMKEVYIVRYLSASGVPSEIICFTYRALVQVTSSGAVVVNVFLITPPKSIEVMGAESN